MERGGEPGAAGAENQDVGLEALDREWIGHRRLRLSVRRVVGRDPDYSVRDSAGAISGMDQSLPRSLASRPSPSSNPTLREPCSPRPGCDSPTRRGRGGLVASQRAPAANLRIRDGRDKPAASGRISSVGRGPRTRARRPPGASKAPRPLVASRIARCAWHSRCSLRDAWLCDSRCLPESPWSSPHRCRRRTPHRRRSRAAPRSRARPS